MDETLTVPEPPGTPLTVHLYVRPGLRALGDRLLIRDWLAITIDRSIVSWRRLDGPELTHELTHVRQWRRYGRVGYVVRYLANSIGAIAGRRSWYRGNAFEVEAYAAQDAVREGRLPDPRAPA